MIIVSLNICNIRASLREDGSHHLCNYHRLQHIHGYQIENGTVTSPSEYQILKSYNYSI